MHFDDSSSVTLLFDFWTVHGPTGMVLTVFVVFLLTVCYELLKVGRMKLEKGSQVGSVPPTLSQENTGDLVPLLEHSPAPSRLLHSLQTALHMTQVIMAYTLMLCVMSYNVWVFMGVIVGSLLGYFLAFPFLVQRDCDPSANPAH